MAISVDFESFYSKKLKYSVRTMIPEQYCSHNLFDAYMVSVCDGESAWSGPVSNLNWDALRGEVWLSHNRRFDNTVHNELIKRKLVPDIRPSAWHCTADMTSFLCNRRALDQAVEFLYGVKPDKSVRSDAEGKKWPSDFTPKEQEAMLKYAKHDAQWCHKLWTDHGDKWPEFERRLADLTTRQGMRGVKINRELLEDYINTTHEMLKNTEKLIPWLKDSEDDDDDDWEGFNTKPTATKCIAEQCRRVGIIAPPLKSKDAEGYEEWEKKFGPRFEWVYAVGAWRSINKLHKEFGKVKARLRAEDTLPFALKYFGAHCLTGISEVLTQGGWIKLEDWGGGDIAQWSPDGSIQFLPAIANEFTVSEPLIQISAPYFSGTFTRGHAMPFLQHGNFSFKTCDAEEFVQGKSRYVPIAGKLDSEGKITADQMRLLVAIQADGCWERPTSIQFTLRKPRKITRLKNLLTRLSLSFTEYAYHGQNGQVSIRVSVSEEFPWLSPARKIFGPWLLDSTTAARQAFLEDLLLWDGHAPTREYYSSIKSNVEWAAIIAHLSGAAMLVREKPQQPGKSRHWAGVLRYTPRAMVFSTQSQTKPFSGKVYCPTTQTGFWIFRTGEKIGVTGNTGRWSGDSGVNMQNMRKVPALMNERGLLEQNEKRIKEAVLQNEDLGIWPAWVQKVIDFRALIVPRAGKKMIVSDLSQIEPRVLAWMVGDKTFLDYVRAGNSPYEAHARTSMGYTGGKMDKNGVLYKLAKARVLGLGYQCAWEKFITMAYTLAKLDITADDPEWIEEENPLTGVVEKRSGYGEGSRKAVADFRSQNPKIVQLWATMDTAFKSSETDKVNDYEVELPSGRKLTYRNVRSSVTIVKDPKTGKPRQKWIVTADVGGRKGRVPFYGGKLVENSTQAISRDVFGFHVLRLEDNGWDNLFSAHDEAVLEVDPDVSAKDVAHEMSVCPEWLKGCPLAAEAKEVKHYLK